MFFIISRIVCLSVSLISIFIFYAGGTETRRHNQHFLWNPKLHCTWDSERRRLRYAQFTHRQESIYVSAKLPISEAQDDTCATLCVRVFYKGFSVDWWALGVLMFEMMAGRSPFDIVGSSDNPDQNTEDYLFQGMWQQAYVFQKMFSMTLCISHSFVLFLICSNFGEADQNSQIVIG